MSRTDRYLSMVKDFISTLVVAGRSDQGEPLAMEASDLPDPRCRAGCRRSKPWSSGNSRAQSLFFHLKILKREDMEIKNFQKCLFILLSIVFPFLTGMGSKPPQVGGPAPAFRLDSLEGPSMALAEHRGKIVLINFWATWCEPCLKEMPEIEAAYEQHKGEGFVVLGINFGEKPKEAEKLVKAVGLTFPILMDRKVEVAERYGVVNLPVTFFIDQEGIIRERVFGGTLTKEGIGEVLVRLQKKS
ncbi:MAG: TlpA family protein disulfide reductase [Candidatus Manganitrophaceae bacterium]|nr:MAG: TlpA family protein disulfide reductase [Candidatus Manganitrophaceae bacterium]